MYVLCLWWCLSRNTLSAPAVARQGVDFVLKGNIIAARFALLCLVSIVLKAHHVVFLVKQNITLNLVLTVNLFNGSVGNVFWGGAAILIQIGVLSLHAIYLAKLWSDLSKIVPCPEKGLIQCLGKRSLATSIWSTLFIPHSPRWPKLDVQLWPFQP